jgi:hypothetical protein
MMCGRRRIRWTAPRACAAGQHAPFSRKSNVSSYKVEQRRLSYRGRDFHFVSYEGRPANERRGEPAQPPMWYLMGPAKRWPVMLHVAGQPDEEVERGLREWLADQEFSRPMHG